MSSRSIVLALLLVVALALPRSSGALQPAPPGLEPQLASKAGCASAKPGKAPGSARWLESCGVIDAKAGPEAAARRVLAARASLLGLRADGRDLALLGLKQTSAATYVRFQQTHQGVPVYLGQVVVQYDRAGRVRLINSQALPQPALDTTPAVDAEHALRQALAALPGGAQLRSPAEQTLVIYGEHGGPELAWHVVLYTQRPLGDWHVMVSAGSGKLLGAWDEIRNDSGSGHIYDPNAIQQTGTTSLVDNADATSTALNNARVSVTLNNLSSGVMTLKGSAVDLTAPGVTGCALPFTPGAASSASRIYSYTRDDDRFEEVTVYAAIDGIQTWFQSLGFTNVNNRATPVDAHCISDDNSFYSSGDKALHFGDGGVDDAEDADIVIHEYGHAVQDDQVPGWGPSQDTEQRAMGEGFGDFLAGIYYLQKGNATYMNSYRYCIGEWDAASYNPVSGPGDGSGCLRWINGIDEGSGADIGTYDGTPDGEHEDGRFWSAALTCIYEGMGANAQARDDSMEIVLEHHFSLVPTNDDSAFEDAVSALIIADETRLGGANKSLIANCAFARGLIDQLPPTLPTPALSVPAAGQSYPASTMLGITWQTNGAPGATVYTLEYTNDCTGSPSWTLIGMSGAGASSYNWTTPAQSGTDYCVRIHGEASGYNDSAYVVAGPFTIGAGAVVTPRVWLPLLSR